MQYGSLKSETLIYNMLACANADVYLCMHTCNRTDVEGCQLSFSTEE